MDAGSRFQLGSGTRLTNKVMQSGEKAVARRLMYDAMEIIREKTGKTRLRYSIRLSRT